jgi:hypothetical protein
MRACILFLLFLLCPGSLFAFWPVYWELGEEKNFFGPLISYEAGGGQTHATVRPLLSSYDSPRTYSIIFPLGKSTEEKSYFLPVYMRHRALGAEDYTLFPFFWGRTSDGRGYGGFFPLYGRLYNRFRRDEIRFFLWPIYAYSEGEGATRTNVVWPIFSFYGGRQEGFKLGPLYGHRKWGDERESSFLFWPIFIKDERFLDTDEPRKSLWAFPLYMQTTSEKYSYHAVMWPLFTFTKTEGRSENQILWPLFGSSKGTESGFHAWPFYSYRKVGKDEVTYIMWPVYKGTDRYPGDRKWTYRRIIIIDRYEADDRGTFFNICPFFEYRRNAAETRFFFPSIIPWRNESFDRIVRPLMTLYEYRSNARRTTTNFLYGFYTNEEEGEYWKRRLAFLLEVKREPQGMGFQVLSGLFGMDKKRIKVFYIPVNRVQAPTPALSGEDREAGPPQASAPE